MNDTNTFSRRKFIKTGSLVSGGILLSFYLPLSGKAGMRAGSGATVFTPNAFISISADNSITFLCNHSEMGQGTYTALTQLIADEMDADWSKITVESAPADAALYSCPSFGMQLTGGSGSTNGEYDRLRKVGASARAMLVSAAAKEWNVGEETLHTDNGYVIDPSGKKLSYGELVQRTEGIKPPAETSLKLKDPKDFKFIGKDVRRVEITSKINGAAVFGMDVKLPGMLVAVIQRPVIFGSTVKSFNPDRAKAVQGVKHVVQIDRGIAVVATGYWAAKKGREALEIEWNDGPLLDTKKQREEYLAMANKPGLVATKERDIANTSGAAKTIEAVYELPFLNHAQMEPLNCTADVKADSCDLYIGTQAQTIDQMTAAQMLGMKPNQIRIHTQLLGGAFGRRASPDGHIVAEAIQTSKAIGGGPVKVMWSREDDLKGGYYRPYSLHKLTASLDKSNNPYSWLHRVVCQSFIIGTMMESMMVKNGIDTIAVEGAAELPYDIPNLQVEWHRGINKVPTLWMRSVGHSYNAYVKECFIDELAYAAGKEPYQFRRGLMDKHVRLRNVLDEAAKISGWGKPLPAGHARGIAVHESFQSFIAQVAEVSVSPAGKLILHKVYVAIDCGPVVNPDNIKAQMEGSVVFALTSLLYGDISFKDGKVEQNNFYDYKILRINETPEVAVSIIKSTDSMGGVGEPGVPPLGPAIANAVFVLTKKRIRKLPFPSDLRTV